MIKYILLTFSSLVSFVGLNAQFQSDFKLAIEPGFVVFSEAENFGLILNIEPKIHASENTAIGLRLGMTINAQTFEILDEVKYYINPEHDHGFFSFTPTFDYKFKIKEAKPFLGIGIGYYLVNNHVDVRTNSSESIIDIQLDKQFGLLMRTGFERNRLRVGLEYNLIPKVDLKTTDGQAIGTVQNSYFGISMGYVIGNDIP